MTDSTLSLIEKLEYLLFPDVSDIAPQSVADNNAAIVKAIAIVRQHLPEQSNAQTSHIPPEQCAKSGENCIDDQLADKPLCGENGFLCPDCVEQHQAEHSQKLVAKLARTIYESLKNGDFVGYVGDYASAYGSLTCLDGDFDLLKVAQEAITAMGLVQNKPDVVSPADPASGVCSEITLRSIRIPEGYALVRLDSYSPRQSGEEIAFLADADGNKHKVFICRHATTMEPVSVDVCAFALEGKLPWLNVRDVKGIATEFAKAVLDAAGVKYVD